MTTAGLTALYESLGGAAWTDNTNWLSGSPCSGFGNWYGVTCSGNTVSGVDLDGNNLNGRLPTQIGFLTSVKYALDLYGNNIYGFIPTEIGLLR